MLSTNPVFRRGTLTFSLKVSEEMSFFFFRQRALFFFTARGPVCCGGQGWDRRWRKVKGRTFHESLGSHQRRKASEDSSDLPTKEVVSFIHQMLRNLVMNRPKLSFFGTLYILIQIFQIPFQSNLKSHPWVILTHDTDVDKWQYLVLQGLNSKISFMKLLCQSSPWHKNKKLQVNKYAKKSSLLYSI